MSRRRTLLLAAGLVLAVALGALFWGEVREELAPEPVAAWVAIEPDGAGVAEDGLLRLAAGVPFTLHAVLEARGRRGPVYYTEAPALRLAGRAVPAEAIRPWTGSGDLRVLWFTVEGFRPYLELAAGPGLEEFRFVEQYRSDWPRAWSIPGRLEPSGWARQPRPPGMEEARFGTQRYHVRLEFFGPESAIRPRLRIGSPGAAEVLGGGPSAGSRAVSGVAASLPGPLAEPSRVFGLTQIEAVGLAQAVGETVGPTLVAWSRQLVAFSRLTVLKEILTREGRAFEELPWRSLELVVGHPWGAAGVSPGDLLRAGERVVVLWQDRGARDRLDPEDLCFDFDKGARVRALGEVFTGDGLVEWGALARRPAAD